MFKQEAFKIGNLDKEGPMSPLSLRKLRAELNWTQSQMGKYLGVEDSTISQWERHRPTRKTIKRLEAVAKFKKLKRSVQSGEIVRPPEQLNLKTEFEDDNFYKMLLIPMLLGAALIVFLIVGR